MTAQNRNMNLHGPLVLLLLLMLLILPATAFVPPHPDSDLAESWEPVHERRRRLQQEFNYTPDFVDHELCRYMTEEECEDVDVNLRDHAKRQQQLFIDTNDNAPQSRQNPAVTMNKQPIRILILLMRFSDHKNRPLPPKSYYEKIWNNRIKTWFDLNSHGRYQYEAVVTDWMDTFDTEAAFAAQSSGLYHGFQQSFWPLLNKLNNKPNWNWSQFDKNKDGKLDAVVVLHSGYPAEVGGLDCTNQRGYVDRIWSHAFASSESWKKGGYALHGYVVASALKGTCGANGAQLGIAVHEYMHTLGLDDLYDTGAGSLGKGIGSWDIMG
jgi:M6 family metalloprotease-like protein